MKNLFYIFIVIFFMSCNIDPEAAINYNGSKVYDKKIIPLNEKCDNAKYEYILTLSIKYPNSDKYYMKNIIVYKIDYNKYNIGDTIK